MNIFVLCTGRCGSLTFAKACTHISNYTSAHESKCGLLGEDRIDYPDNHIEIDNRLSWLLGRLDEKYGNDAFYVHLVRDMQATAESLNRRWNGKYSIIRAYSQVILMYNKREIDVCEDYWHTVHSNIKFFLRDKSHKMLFDLENAEDNFFIFWQKIKAEGNLDAALQKWKVRYNFSK